MGSRCTRRLGCCVLAHILARKRKKQRQLSQEIEEVRLDCDNSFKLINGQWYLVTYETIDVGCYDPVRATWDVIQRRMVQLTWGRNRVAVNKRQCNREEVRKIHGCIAQWKKEVRRM